MHSPEMHKVVYKDDLTTKAITCQILEEDQFFITIKASYTGLTMRIGKGSIVSIKPLRNELGGL